MIEFLTLLVILLIIFIITVIRDYYSPLHISNSPQDQTSPSSIYAIDKMSPIDDFLLPSSPSSSTTSSPCNNYSERIEEEEDFLSSRYLIHDTIYSNENEELSYDNVSLIDIQTNSFHLNSSNNVSSIQSNTIPALHYFSQQNIALSSSQSSYSTHQIPSLSIISIPINYPLSSSNTFLNSSSFPDDTRCGFNLHYHHHHLESS